MQRAVLFVMILSLAFGLPACGGKDGGGGSSAAAGTSLPTDLACRDCVREILCSEAC